MYIGISVISTGCLLMFVNYSTAINYEPLIMPICKEYDTTSVSIFTGNYNLTYEQKITLHRIIKALSKNRISTGILSYKQLKMGLQLRNGSTTHSLIVIIIDTIHDFTALQTLITRHIGIRYRIWLLIFKEFKPVEFCKTRTKPHFVVANQRFGDKMIISCWESNITHKFLSNEDNFLRDFRYSLDGRPLRVVGTPKSATTFTKKATKLSELILKELFRAMNASVSQFIENPSTTYDRLLGNKFDITDHFYLLENPRRSSVEVYTTPVLSTQYYLFFRKQPNNSLVWNTHFQVMTVSVWLVITAAILLTILSLTAIKYVRGGHFFPILYEEYSHTWGMYCGQGLPEFPKQLPLRIVCITTLSTVFIISNMYSSFVLSSLTIPSDSPFTTLEEFLDDGTYQLIQLKNKGELLKSVHGPARYNMMSLLKPEELWPLSTDEAFEQICTQKLAYYGSYVIDAKTILPCDIATINIPSSNQVAFLVAPTSGYRHLVNYHIQKLRTSGVLRRLQTLQLENFSIQPTAFSIGVQHIAIPFTILGVGLFLTSVVFIIEINWKKIMAIKKSLTRIRQACMLSKYDCFRACKVRCVANCRK